MKAQIEAAITRQTAQPRQVQQIPRNRRMSFINAPFMPDSENTFAQRSPFENPDPFGFTPPRNGKKRRNFINAPNPFGFK